MTEDVTPVALVSAALRGSGMSAVTIRTGDEEIVAVVEAGTDPRTVWFALRQFLEREGILAPHEAS